MGYFRLYDNLTCQKTHVAHFDCTTTHSALSSARNNETTPFSITTECANNLPLAPCNLYLYFVSYKQLLVFLFKIPSQQKVML